MSVARTLSAALACAAIGGCAPLPSVEAGICGNSVIESSEDCDMFAPGPTFECRPPGSLGECRLDCRARGDGSRASCPDGWGCSVDGICRPTTGAFDTLQQHAVSGAWSLMASNFDGDRRAEIVSRQPFDAVGRTRLAASYFDERGELDETVVFPKLVFAPAVTDLSGDGRTDLVFSDFRVGLLLGQTDRSWAPKTFSSYSVRGARLRLATVYFDRVGSSFPVIPLIDSEDMPGFYAADELTGRLRLLAPLPGGFDSIVGEPASGNLFEDPIESPCFEIVVALRGEAQFSVTDVCTYDAELGVVWRDTTDQRLIELDPPGAIDRGPQVVDMNGDGHLDVLVGAAGKPYVAFGDGQTLASATPYRLALANSSQLSPDIPMPLAAGQITDDGAIDFVFEDHVLVSSPARSAGELPTYVIPFLNFSARWSVAEIADMNGNGTPDIVAASKNGINVDFLNGTGSEYLNPSVIPTKSSVEHLGVGDFDGDLVADLALIEKSSGPAGDNSLSIAFGSSGPPSSPALIGRLGQAVQLVTYAQGGLEHMALVSRASIGGEDSDTLAILPGSPDRMPFAPLDVTTFSSDGSVEGYAVFALTHGAFTAPGRQDVMLIANSDIDNQAPWRFWVLTDLAGVETGITRLETRLHPRLLPAHVASLDIGVNVTAAAGDLDGDGIAEGIWVMPADDEQHCGVAIVNALLNEPVVSNLRVIEGACPRAEVLPVDADGDGFLDIAVLTGAAGAGDRKLVVLWNDGSGTFTDAQTSVLSGSDSPEQFAVLPATPERPQSFAWVTPNAVVLSSRAAGREFQPPVLLTELDSGSGIVAADVDGDGVTDLAVAESGSLQLLRAQLRAP